MEKLKELLAKECTYKLADTVLSRFLECGMEISLKPNEVLIREGKINTNIYILKEGIVRNTYLEGLKDITIGFALPGTMIIDMHSYYMRKPAFFQIEACCDSILLKITKEDFDRLLKESHEFALWVLRMEQCQLFHYEMKHSVINGDARERFKALLKNRPEIMQKVPLRMIASYLGITQSYLSRLRKQVFLENRKERI